MPAITLGYLQHKDYFVVLENNNKKSLLPHFTTVASSAQQMTSCLFVEVCPELWKKDPQECFNYAWKQWDFE